MTTPNSKIGKPLRIGLFGGTFDPIHHGHIKAAKGIRNRLKLDKIYFIPAHVSPFKNRPEVSEGHHRLEMVKRAIKDIPDFYVSEFELSKKEISYTVDTIRHYNALYPENTEFFFILGTDAFLGLSQWKSKEVLFESCNFVVVSRPGYHLRPLAEILQNPKLVKKFVEIKKDEQYKHFTGHSILLFQIPTADISSTTVRQKIANRTPYSLFVSEPVADYIRAHDLYKRG